MSLNTINNMILLGRVLRYPLLLFLFGLN